MGISEAGDTQAASSLFATLSFLTSGGMRDVVARARPKGSGHEMGMAVDTMEKSFDAAGQGTSLPPSLGARAPDSRLA